MAFRDPGNVERAEAENPGKDPHLDPLGTRAGGAGYFWLRSLMGTYSRRLEPV
jgi:hypothetical protein